MISKAAERGAETRVLSTTKLFDLPAPSPVQKT
jgi:hypothetical protein